MKKKKIILIISIFITLIILIKWDRSYKINYKIDDIKIEESYNKQDKKIYININKDKKIYTFVIDREDKKKVVKKIDYYTDKKITCLNIKSNQSTKPICYDNEKLVSINLINSKKIKNHYKIKQSKDEVKQTINNLNIYDYANYQYFIWNYKNLWYLNRNEQKQLQVTNKDVYNIKIATKIDNYLIIADYNQEYIFNKFIIINIDTLKKEIWNIDYEISFNSYFLGTNDKSVFLVDKKNKIEYEIVPYKKKMRIVGTKDKKGIIYKNNKEEKISLNQLIKKENNFTKEGVYNYKVINNNLYLNYKDSKEKILIDNSQNIKIIDTINDTVFYLINDKLYSYNPVNLTKLIMQNFEWNFNNNNIFFIFK